MSTMLNFGRDVQGYNAYAPKPSTDKYSTTLAASTAATVTVPSNFENWIVVFSYSPSSSVWVSFTTTAAVPAGATLASSGSELNPAARSVTAGTVISVISSAIASVGVTFYAVS